MNSAIFHPGQLLAQGRYRIDRLLGEGGMGAVYEATELTLERKVALKVLLPEPSQHPTARQRMEAEAKAMARLNSPHVVRVNTVFDEGGLLVIDLEFMAGGSLAEKLDGRGVDEARARDWISQILKGLEALHKVGLVHRDLKPANVLLDEHGVLKVTDLGIAQDSQRTGGLKTRHDANLGTAEYMAPEQVQSAATVDARADVYAAGVMLYEFLTGRVPFQGEDWAVKAAQVRDLPDLAGLQATSAQAAAVLAVALAKQPDQRFRTANAMAEALATPTADSSVAARKRPRNQSAQAPESGIAGSEAKPSGLPRAALIFAASVALLLLGVGGWKYASGSEERAAQAEALEPDQAVSGARPPVGTPTEAEATVQGAAPGIPAAVAQAELAKEKASPVDPAPAGDTAAMASKMVVALPGEPNAADSRRLPGGSDQPEPARSAKTTRAAKRLSEQVKDGDGCDKGDISMKVRASAASLRACYETQLISKPTLAGKVVVLWTINGAGKVENDKVVDDSMNNSAVSDCVQRTIRRIHFSKPAVGVCVIQWPFVFNPG